MLVNTKQLQSIMEGWGGILVIFLERFKRHCTGMTPKIQQKNSQKMDKNETKC